MGTLVLMTSVDGGEQFGDRKVPWDPTNPDQVSQANAKFDEYVGKGFRAYRMGPKGARGERITEFDPNAGEIVFTGKHGFVGG